MKTKNVAAIMDAIVEENQATLQVAREKAGLDLHGKPVPKVPAGHTYFTGRVQAVLFENVSQGFYILKVKLDSDDSEDLVGSSQITVRGNIPGLAITVGVWFGFEGKWVKHEKYGRQVEITRAPVIHGGWDAVKIKKVLSAHGVGRLTLQLLHERFGEELEAALGNAELLEEVPGIDKLSAEHIVSRWFQVKAMFQALSLLGEFNLPKQKIDQVWGQFGDETEEMLSQDPWRLLQVDGITFQQADEIALRMGSDMSSPSRLVGALLYVMQTRRGAGHMYMLTGDLVRAVRDLAGAVDKVTIARALKTAHQADLVVLDNKTRPGTVAVYEPWLYEIESKSAALLLDRAETAKFTDQKEILKYTKMLGQVGLKAAKHAADNVDDLRGTAEVALREWTEGSRVHLERLQMRGALNALTEPVSVITGLPGTGKCVVPGTWISTSEGFKTIGSFGGLPHPGEAVRLEVSLDTSKGPKTTSAFYDGGVADTVKITTRCGFTLEGTPEHPIRVRRNGETVWAPLGESVGEEAILVRGGSSFGEGSFLEHPPETYVLELRYTFPEQVNPELASILGYIASETTNVSRNRILVRTQASKIHQRLQTLFEETFNYSAGLDRHPQCGIPMGVRIYSKEIIAWLLATGVKVVRAVSKEVPWAILEAPKACVVAFLKALFEIDGSCDAETLTVKYGASSQKMAEQVQMLLLALGVVAAKSEVSYRGKPYWTLEIQARDLCFDLIKVPWSEDEEPSEGVFYDRIVRVETGNSQVYDFTVPDGHEFLSNGFVSHNTFTLRTVVKVLQDAEVPFLLVAPTGIAAKRIHSVTGAEASTIHRAFQAQGMDMDDGRKSTYAGIVGASEGLSGADGSAESWGFGPDTPHPAEVIIVDESSMVDQHLLFRILECTSAKCRVVFVGDAAQLPSVGPGNVLRDMIASDMFPVTRLTEIYRQEETSDIVLAAHAINEGRAPKPTPGKNDFGVIELHTEEKVLEKLLSTVQKLYDKHANFQVLSPRHAGVLGVTNLNARMRGILNPKSPGLQEMRLGSETIREGDRVMVVKNNYQYEIFNGDVGKVTRLDRKEKHIEIKIWGPPEMFVKLPLSDAPSHLRLAYAMTVHKCLHPDTLVETLQGLVPISSLPDIGVVGAPGGSKRYLRKVVNPKALMLKLMTKEGYEISVTPDHGLDVWDLAQETYVRKEARNVAWGDLLRLRRKPEVDAVGPVELLPPEGCQEERLPSVVDAKTAEFLGLFFAAGRRYDSGFYIEHRHQEVAERFTVLCELLFGVKAHRFSERGFYCVEVVSTFLSRWMVQIKAHRADVPACILQSPLTVQRWFLRGLFEAGSVHLCPLDSRLLDRIELPVDSFPLVQKVRTMLLRFGIVCEVREGGVGLQLCGEDAKRFGETIGFITNVKQDQATYLTEPTSRYEVPVGLALFRALREELNEKISQWVCRNASKRQKISRHAAREILKHSTGSPAQQELAALLEDHHSPVVSIDEFESPSVCVEVPDGHRFLQNGFYGWNSQGQEYDMIVMPWVTGFRHQLQRNLIYTAITRAKKKVILFGHPAAVKKAVLNNDVQARNTLFPERLRTRKTGSPSPEKA